MDQDTLLARWLAGELSETELAQLEQSPEFPTLARIKSNFETLRKPDFDAPKILEDVLRTPKRAPKVLPLYTRRWFQVAAAAVVFVALAITFFLPNYESAGKGESLAFNLPDDSQVVLNSGSEARFSAWNWNKKREVSLDGEAYFKVAKGKKFTVETKLGNVEVLGTQFNVKSRESRFEVVCYEGKVQVSVGAQEFVLTPGNGVAFNGQQQLQNIDSDVAAPQWLNGEIVFYAERFEHVVAEIERRYDVEIDASLQTEQLFTGALPAKNLDAALKIVSVAYHLNVGKSNGKITLTP